MRKISISPAFIAFSIFLIATGKSLALLNTVVCCTMHELGHVRAAATRGYRLNRMIFMPYGAMVTGGEAIHPLDETAISLWGPLVNLIMFSAIAALWWIVPESYRFTRALAFQNLAIAVFNLLPLYPLDMSRILIARAKNKKRMLSILRWLGVAAAGAFFLLFIVSLWNTVNFTLLISAFMLFSGSFYGIKSEEKMYEFNTAYVKDKRHPVEIRRYRVSEALPLSRILRLMNPQTLMSVQIVSQNEKIIAELEESELVELASRAAAGATLGDLCRQRNDTDMKKPETETIDSRLRKPR